MPGVADELERLAKAHAALEDAISAIAQRISPVSVPMGGATAKEATSAPERPLSPVGETVRAQRKKAESMVGYLREMLPAIDV